MRTVVGVHPCTPRHVSRTNASAKLSVALAARFLPLEFQPMNRPVELIDGKRLSSLPAASSMPILMSVLAGTHAPSAPKHVSRTKICCLPLSTGPPFSRSVACPAKTIYRPSGEISAWLVDWFGSNPKLLSTASLVDGVQPRTAVGGKPHVSRT